MIYTKEILTLKLCTILLAFLISCSDDSPSPVEPTIIGIWDQVGLEISECTDEEENGPQTVESTVWTFNADSTFALMQDQFLREGTYSLSGENLNLVGDLIEEIPRTFTVTLTTLTIIEDTQEDGCILTNSMTKREE